MLCLQGVNLLPRAHNHTSNTITKQQTSDASQSAVFAGVFVFRAGRAVTLRLPSAAGRFMKIG
jgi:hypothetical protein